LKSQLSNQKSLQLNCANFIRLMRHAQESSVLEVGCNPNGLMVVTKFQDPVGPFFYYDPPTNESFGAGPPGFDSTQLNTIVISKAPTKGSPWLRGHRHLTEN